MTKLTPGDLRGTLNSIHNQVHGSAGDGVALTAVAHPRGAPMKRGLPTKEVAARRAAAFETIEIDLPPSAAAKPFDKRAWMREYMREYRKTHLRRKKGGSPK